MPASRAYSSSSGGAACHGGTWGQPQGSTPGVRGWFKGDLSEKNFLWRTNNRHRTDRCDSRNSYVDMYSAQLYFKSYWYGRYSSKFSFKPKISITNSSTNLSSTSLKPSTLAWFWYKFCKFWWLTWILYLFWITLLQGVKVEKSNFH